VSASVPPARVHLRLDLERTEDSLQVAIVEAVEVHRGTDVTLEVVRNLGGRAREPYEP